MVLGTRAVAWRLAMARRERSDFAALGALYSFVRPMDHVSGSIGRFCHEKCRSSLAGTLGVDVWVRGCPSFEDCLEVRGAPEWKRTLKRYHKWKGLRVLNEQESEASAVSLVQINNSKDYIYFTMERYGKVKSIKS